MNPQKTAFLFPGQGSQEIGMGFELSQQHHPAREVFAQADDILGFSLSQLAWEGPEDELNDTMNTQPALLTHSVAVLRVFKEMFPEFTPAFVAGHSMGELSALVAAGALPFDRALRLARRRGELMKEAGESSPGGMAAILGLDTDTVEAICSQASRSGEIVQLANDNCPGQVVISGSMAALQRAMELAKAANARKVVPLSVSIAAHSPLMDGAQTAFNQVVNEAQIQKPAIPIIGNVSAQPLTSAQEIQEDLMAQLRSPVRWTESVRYLIATGVETFVELGGGGVLTGLIKRIDRQTKRIALSKPKDFIGLLPNKRGG